MKSNSSKPAAKRSNKPVSRKVIASKKKFSLTSLQKKAVIIIAAVVVVIGGLLVWQASTDSGLFAASCKDKTFRKGASSACIKYAKQIMKADGVSNDGDSILGPKSIEAVKKFQKKHSSVAGSADGIIGPKTWKALCSVGKSKAAAAAKNAGCSVSSAKTTSKSTTKTTKYYKKGAYIISSYKRTEYPTKPSTNLKSTTGNVLTSAELQRINRKNTELLGQKNKDDKLYNLSWKYLTTFMSESVLKNECSKIGGKVKSKSLYDNTKYVVRHPGKTKAHKICGI